MKKSIALVLIFAMCLSFCACSNGGVGKSEAVKAAEAAIAAIGEVTVDSGDAIANAEKLYGILTDTEKAEVENRLTLVEAQEKFDDLTIEVIYNNAKIAYDKLSVVADLCVTGMDYIYDAWYFGIYDADDCTSSSVFASLSIELGFSFGMDDLESAAASIGLDGWDLCDDWQNCLWTVETALEQRGDYATIDEAMKEANDILQELTTEYDDYTYYPELKKLYSAVDSYVQFYLSPSGSFNQLADTVRDYENNIRTLQSDVGFLFNK